MTKNAFIELWTASLNNSVISIVPLLIHRGAYILFILILCIVYILYILCEMSWLYFKELPGFEQYSSAIGDLPRTQ
jgi:hypothetical protein